MLHFATLFDFNYLSRGLSLIESLDKVLNKNYTLYILALDEKTCRYIKAKNCNHLVVIKLNDIEQYCPALAEIKKDRSKVEYFFTLSPILPLYIFDKFNSCERITTLDADIFFFSSPLEIFQAYHSESILITPHDFSSSLSNHKIYGSFNVSFQSFPRTINSISLLKDWMVKCLNWCRDYVDDNTLLFADQKYLDSWEECFENIQPINLKTCGRAPWNISETAICIRNNQFYVNNNFLIYYHFHGLRIHKNVISHGLKSYDVKDISKAAIKMYKRYIACLTKQNEIISYYKDDSINRNSISYSKKSDLINVWENETGFLIYKSKSIYFNISYVKKLFQKARRIKYIGN